MSPKNPSIFVGLAAPGLLWLATSVASGQTAPAPPGPPTPAPTSPTYRALLLSSGKVVQGEISEDAAGSFRLRANGGPVTYPRTMVLKAGGSVEELYQFQVSRLPTGDTGERMKLVRWCLTEQLHAHAREQLEAIRKMCPEDAEVQRMLYNLASTNFDRPRVDPDLRRTSGEATRDGAPGVLDPRSLVKVTRQYNTLPVIFDLSQAQAVVRAKEFFTYVQPILQKSCVKCHNEQYQGNFQLVEIKLKRDSTNPDIARANLDAALRLVNPDDPTRSELLSAGLVPHGGSKNAIFRGPNDPPYTILLTWVKSLRPAATGPKGPAEAGSRPGFSSPEPMPGDGFATERSAKPGPSTSYPSASFPAGYRPNLPQLPGVEFAQRAAAGSVAPPPRATVNNYEESATFITSPGDNPQFPSPIPPGGLPPIPAAAPMTGPVAGKATPKGATSSNPSKVVVAPTDDPNKLPGMGQPLYPNSPKADPEADDEEAKIEPSSKKPRKIDNALLEKLMKNRNGTP